VGAAPAHRERRNRAHRALAAVPLHGVDLTAPPGSGPPPIAEILDHGEGSLLDLVDHLLNQGVVLQAEVVLGLASIDLIYVRLTAVVCAADRILPLAK
jgi:hypothetical protein